MRIDRSRERPSGSSRKPRQCRLRIRMHRTAFPFHVSVRIGADLSHTGSDDRYRPRTPPNTRRTAPVRRLIGNIYPTLSPSDDGIYVGRNSQYGQRIPLGRQTDTTYHQFSRQYTTARCLTAPCSEPACRCRSVRRVPKERFYDIDLEVYKVIVYVHIPPPSHLSSGPMIVQAVL